jgi:hypothetical protein
MVPPESQNLTSDLTTPAATGGPYRTQALAAARQPPRGLIVRHEPDELVIETSRWRGPLLPSLICTGVGLGVALAVPGTVRLIGLVLIVGAVTALDEILTGPRTLRMTRDRVTFRLRAPGAFDVHLADFRLDRVTTGKDLYDRQGRPIRYLRAVVDGQEARLFIDLPFDTLVWIDEEIRRWLEARAVGD